MTVPACDGVMSGRVALVTGAAGTIGAATAMGVAAAGGRVLATDVDERGLLATAATIRAANGPDAVRTRVDDLRDPTAADRLVAATVAEFGGLDVLVHAAVDEARGRLEDLTPQMWHEAYEVNVGAAVWLTRAALPHLRSGRGSVVLFSSVQAHGGLPGCSVYGSTKGAVDSLVKHLAVELGPAIRVNAISPAWVTPDPDPDPTELPAYPLGRVGRPEEIASLVVFLASEAAGWITGSVVSADGGMSALNPGQASRNATRVILGRRWRAAVQRRLRR